MKEKLERKYQTKMTSWFNKDNEKSMKSSQTKNKPAYST